MSIVIPPPTTRETQVQSAAFSAFYPRLGREDLSVGNLTKKAASAVLVAAGAILINQ